MEKIRQRRKRRIAPTIESVAMTDVVFLLLIFFMLSTTFVTLDSGIKIELPTGGMRSIEVQDEINLKITNSGDIFFHGRQINENFAPVLTSALETSNTKTVIISADKNVVHGFV
ncbi:MAG: biopolymer transporter ExbD, partial [Candidatus Muiribacteriota bacterium]